MVVDIVLLLSGLDWAERRETSARHLTNPCVSIARCNDVPSLITHVLMIYRVSRCPVSKSNRGSTTCSDLISLLVPIVGNISQYSKRGMREV